MRSLDLSSVKRLADKVLGKAADRRKRRRPAELLSEIVDGAWYAERFGLDASADPARHYASEGADRRLAPHPDLAGPDGETLTQWGAELLFRMRAPVGARPQPLLDEAALPEHAAPADAAPERRIVFVTAIFGAHDRLLPVDPAWREEADFVAFADHRYSEAMGWRLTRSPYAHAEPRRRARAIKTSLPTLFPDRDWVIWVDGNILVCRPPGEILRDFALDGVDFASFQHPFRNSVVAEAAECLRYGLDAAPALFASLRDAAARGDLGAAPLFETNVLFARPAAGPVRALFDAWRGAIETGSKRDQISLPGLVAATPGLRWGFLPEPTARAGRSFAIGHHL